MQFDIQHTDPSSAADALTEHASRRLRFGLTRHGAFVRQVQVRLGRDASGCDVVCRIRILLLDAAPAQVETSGPDAGAAIDLAVDRAARLVAQRCARPRRKGVYSQVEPGPAAPAAGRRPGHAVRPVAGPTRS